MTFEQALSGVKRGYSVKRENWVDAFIALECCMICVKHKTRNGNYRTIEYTTSSRDLLAEDWKLVE